MLTSTSHSVAVSVFFNDWADLVLECSTSEQVVVEDFTFLLVSFQFFFKLGDGMGDGGVVVVMDGRQSWFVSELLVDLVVNVWVGDQM